MIILKFKIVLKRLFFYTKCNLGIKVIVIQATTDVRNLLTFKKGLYYLRRMLVIALTYCVLIIFCLHFRDAPTSYKNLFKTYVLTIRYFS